MYFYPYGFLAVSCLYLPSCHCFDFQLTCTARHDFVKPLLFLDHLYFTISVFVSNEEADLKTSRINYLSFSPNLRQNSLQFAFVRLLGAGQLTGNKCSGGPSCKYTFIKLIKANY